MGALVLFVIAVLLVTSLLASLIIVGPWIVGDQVAAARATADIASTLSGPIGNFVTSVDQTVTMLFSISLGLIAVIGVTIRDVAKTGNKLSWKIGVLLCLFIATTVWSVFLAYLSRLATLRAVSFSSYPDPQVEALISLLGMLVAVSAGLAILTFVAVYRSGLLKSGEER